MYGRRRDRAECGAISVMQKGFGPSLAGTTVPSGSNSFFRPNVCGYRRKLLLPCGCVEYNVSVYVDGYDVVTRETRFQSVQRRSQLKKISCYC